MLHIRTPSLRILHAPTNRLFKGTEYIESAITQLIEEGYKIDLRIAENMTHKELFDEYKSCDIFIDQISTGWYGTASLEAMAFGKTTLSYYDEFYFEYIDYHNEIPVIKITKDNLKSTVKDILEYKYNLYEMGLRSRSFVEKYHDIENVTSKLIEIYKKLWSIE